MSKESSFVIAEKALKVPFENTQTDVYSAHISLSRNYKKYYNNSISIFLIFT